MSCELRGKQQQPDACGEHWALGDAQRNDVRAALRGGIHGEAGRPSALAEHEARLGPLREHEPEQRKREGGGGAREDLERQLLEQLPGGRGEPDSDHEDRRQGHRGPHRQPDGGARVEPDQGHGRVHPQRIPALRFTTLYDPSFPEPVRDG
jgi:hypothetical protein